MLTTLTFFPILGAFILKLSTQYSNNLLLINLPLRFDNPDLKPGYDLKVRQIALLFSVLTFIMSTLIWCYFDSNDLSYQFVSYWPTIAGLGGAKVGVDAFGLIFILLTTYLMPIAILSTWDNVQHGILSHLICLLFIEGILIAIFISLDIICFYVTFEAVLIPLYLLVGSQGATNSRIKASVLLFLYTLGGSLFMLLGLIRLLDLMGVVI